MSETLIEKTELGTFLRDITGVWHYKPLPPDHGHTLAEFAADACKYRGNKDAVWLWWFGAFVPMLKDDDVNTLSARWETWEKLVWWGYGVRAVLTKINTGISDPGYEEKMEKMQNKKLS